MRETTSLVYRIYYRRFENRPTQYVDVWAVSKRQAYHFLVENYGADFFKQCVDVGVDYARTESEEPIGTIKGVRYGL